MTLTYSLPTAFNPEAVSLTDRTILIVGADTDLGQAIALDLSRTGAELILQATRQRQVSGLYDQITAEPGPHGAEPLIAEINLAQSDASHLATLADGLADSVTRIDGIVYLGTPSSSLAPLALTGEQQVVNAFDQGVLQPMRLINSLLPLLEKSEDPCIVFQTWAAGRQAKPYWTANGTACAARENLAATLAAEHEQFRVATIDFGRVASALRHRAYPAEARSELRECDDPLLLNSVRYLITEGQSGLQFALPDK